MTASHPTSRRGSPGRPRTRRAAAGIGASAVAAIPTGVLAASYVVRPGDTLTGIAERHGTTARSLATVNGIARPDRIEIGQLLHIPDPGLGLPRYVQGAVDDETYRVRRGDDLLQIGRRFGTDAATLARANGMRVGSVLREGTVLRVPGRLARIDRLLTRTATSVGVAPTLVRAVSWMESGWQQDVVSPTGAIGLMQVEPYTGDWVSRYLAGRQLDLRSAADNVRAGSLLLGHLLATHLGDVRAALAGYYQGDLSIARHGLYQDTIRYQEGVLSLMRRE